jgi:hypothetical protein
MLCPIGYSPPPALGASRGPGGHYGSMAYKRNPDQKSSPNWHKPLPKVIDIPKVMTLTALADVRAFVRHLPTIAAILLATRRVRTRQGGGRR